MLPRLRLSPRFLLKMMIDPSGGSSVVLENREMKDENKRKLKKLKRLASLVAALTLVWVWIKDFITFNINYEQIILVLGMSLVYIITQIEFILRSEEGKDISMDQKKEITFAMGFLWCYLIFLGILFLAIIPSQIRYLNKILGGAAPTVSFSHMLEILGTIIPVFGALGIFVGGVFIITLKNWSRLLVIYSCLGINLEIMHMMITGWSKAEEVHLFISLVFVLCAFPVFFLVHPKIKDQFMQNSKYAKD